MMRRGLLLLALPLSLAAGACSSNVDPTPATTPMDGPPANTDFDSIAVPQPSCVGGWRVALVPHRGSDPQWAVAPDGTMHIMFIGFGEDQTALRHVSERDPSQADTLGAMGLGSLAIAPDGTPTAFLAARSTSDESPDSVGIVRVAKAASGWHQDPVAVSSDGGMINASAIDAAGHAHVAFGDGALYYETDAGGAWAKTMVSDAQVEVSVWSLQLDGAGNVHVWFSGVDPASGVTGNYWATNAGGTWQTRLLPASDVAPAIDSQGRPHVISNDGAQGGLAHLWFDGASWQIEPLTTLGSVGGYDLKIDAADKLHLLIEIDQANIVYADNVGGAWQMQSVIAFDAPQVPSAHLGLDSAGQPHIAFKASTSGATLGFARRCQ